MGSNPTRGTIGGRNLPAPDILCGMRLHKNLSQVRERLNKAREELRIAEEQLLFQMDVLEEAKTRALVAETPLADRDYQDARRDYDLADKARGVVQDEIKELEAEQDRLLDRMLG